MAAIMGTAYRFTVSLMIEGKKKFFDLVLAIRHCYIDVRISRHNYSGPNLGRIRAIPVQRLLAKGGNRAETGYITC